MKCFTHPQADAVAQCTSCNKGVCALCAQDIVETGILCPSCLQDGLHAQIARNQRRVYGVWIFAGVITAIAAIVAFSSISSSGAGAILYIPLAFAASWCFFWGWPSVWNWFRRQGFWVAGSWFVILIIIGLTFEVLILVALAIGAFTGIKKYNEARRGITSGNQMLAEIAGQALQQMPGTQGGGTA